MIGETRATVLLLLILCVVLVAFPNVKIVKAEQGTIYIRADGTVEGTDKIRLYGGIYRFVDDINTGESPYGISIEKDNIVVDGAGHTLQGNFNTSQTSSGVSITGVHLRGSHVTIRNLNIENYRSGIQQSRVTNNYFADNKITYCNTGFASFDSPNNILRSNKLENNVEHLRISVDTLAQYNNNIDQTNTVDGKPIIYWVQRHNSGLLIDAGLVFLIDCTKITIQNLNLSTGQNIFLHSTKNSTIQYNSLIGNRQYAGIHLHNSTNIRIIENTIESQSEGIYLQDSSNNQIEQNQFVNNAVGIEFQSADDNIIGNNAFSENGECIHFTVALANPTPSLGNTIFNNELVNNYDGIIIAGENIVSGNVVTENAGKAMNLDGGVTVIDNLVADNQYGIDVTGQDNVLRNNTLMNNRYNMFASRVHISYWRGSSVVVLANDIDSSNTVNGKPVYYWVSKRNERVPSNAGYVMLVNCDNITVQDQNICSNGEGIVLLNTTNSRVFGNNISDTVIGVGLFLSKQNMISENLIQNNDEGMRIGSSVNNTITFNNITLNNVWGINFKGSQTNNTIYYNNFIDNGSGNLQISIDKLYGLGLGNFWDNGTVGNYWSDYLQRYPNASTKSGYILVGNTPFYINENNIDAYPLMEPIIIPEFPSWTILPILITITLVVIIAKQKLKQNANRGGILI